MFPCEVQLSRNEPLKGISPPKKQLVRYTDKHKQTQHEWRAGVNRFLFKAHLTSLL